MNLKFVLKRELLWWD